MKIYDYEDYKIFVKAYVKELPDKGRGEYGRIAKAAQISSTLVSQIFNGDRELSLEQAFLLCKHMNLSSEESDYFELLVLYRRCGLQEQKKEYKLKINAIRQKHKSFKASVKPENLNLSPHDEVKYYTEWIHSAVRLLSEIEDYQNLDSLSEKLNVDRDQVKKSAEFLKSLGLVDFKSGKVSGLKSNLHLEKSSPLTYLRQLTWRMKALENFQRRDPQDFTFNALVTLKEAQIEVIRAIIQKAVADAGVEVEKATKPDEMMCLNIDFFRV